MLQDLFQSKALREVRLRAWESDWEDFKGDLIQSGVEDATHKLDVKVWNESRRRAEEEQENDDEPVYKDTWVWRCKKGTLVGRVESAS